MKFLMIISFSFDYPELKKHTFVQRNNQSFIQKMEKEQTHTCVDCGTQNCKFKDRTYPPFCPTTHLKKNDRQWALERYDEGKNREIMIASAEVEYEGYCQWTRVQEIMEFARKINAHKIGNSLQIVGTDSSTKHVFLPRFSAQMTLSHIL